MVAYFSIRGIIMASSKVKNSESVLMANWVNDGVINVPYPTGSDASEFGVTGHSVASSSDVNLYVWNDTISVSFGLTSIEITNKSGRTIPAGSVIYCSFLLKSGENDLREAARLAKDANGNVIGVVGSSGEVFSLTASYTFAEFQTAIANGYVGTAFVSDIGNGSMWVSDGVRGRPLNGEIVLHNSQAGIALVNTTPRAVGIAIPLPIGLFQDNDVLEISIDESKSGTVDASTTQLQIGTSQVTVGTQVGNSSMVMSSGGNRRAFGTFRVKRNSATSVTVLNGPNGQDGVSASSDKATATTAPSNLDVGTNYLQLTNAMATGGTDVVTVDKFIVRLITG